MKWTTLVLLTFVAGASAFLFPGGGGGGGGCGCEDTSCFPKPPRLACQRFCFSIPTLRLPSPCGGGCGGCGGRKKRAAIGDEKCSDPKLKEIIDDSIRNTPKESRDNILAGLKEKFAGTRYLVSCVTGKHEFVTTAESYCNSGTEHLSCFVARAVDQE